MNMKKLMTIVVAAISIATFAKGIYFVSGGDFREARIKYVIETTNNNQDTANHFHYPSNYSYNPSNNFNNNYSRKNCHGYSHHDTFTKARKKMCRKMFRMQF